MARFNIWLLLREQLDPEQYDQLFDAELLQLIQRLGNVDEKHNLEQMLGYNWTAYIMGALRRSGFLDQQDLEEKTHDIVTKLILLPGGLFSNYDTQRHGPLEKRFKRSLANAIKNILEKQRNRKRLLPSVPIYGELPARQAADPFLIDQFRGLVHLQLGALAVKVFDQRMEGGEIKSLVNRTDLGRPSSYRIKQMVAEIKKLSIHYADRLGDPDFARMVNQAMELESKTVARRKVTLASHHAAKSA